MLTRPIIISRLIEIVREHTEKINDKETLEELLIITRNEDGRIEAPAGCHDDDMMGLAIAYETKEQVDFSQDVITTPSQHQFSTERKTSTQYDYGEEIVVI